MYLCIRYQFLSELACLRCSEQGQTSALEANLPLLFGPQCMSSLTYYAYVASPKFMGRSLEDIVIQSVKFKLRHLTVQFSRVP